MRLLRSRRSSGGDGGGAEREEEGAKEEEESNNTLRRYRLSNGVYLVTFICCITVTFSLEESRFFVWVSFSPFFYSYV